MIPKSRELLTVVMALCFGLFGSVALASVPISVDTRVELAAVIARLADFEEFKAAGIPSYDAEVEQHFGRFKDHPTVDLLRQFRSNLEVGYGDTVALALLAQPESWEPRLDLKEWLPNSSTNWDVQSAGQMLAAISRFSRDTEAAAFFTAHSALYSLVTKQIADDVHDSLDAPWFDGISEDNKPVRMMIVPGLLHGRGNYGPRIIMSDGTVDAYAVIGTPKFAAGDSLKWPGAGTSRLLVHEFAHSFVNPWVDAHADVLKSGAVVLYESNKARMRQNAYGDWNILLYESLTRAVTLRYFLDHDLHDQVLAAKRDDEQRGFGWTLELANLLPATAPLLATEVIPSISSLLTSWADTTIETQVAAPNASLFPSSGDLNVDPGLNQITVIFDRPMSADIGVFGDQTPEFSGPPSWSDDGTELHLPVELKPGTEYELYLNHAEMPGGFKSRDGIQLAPIPWTFQTQE